MYITITHYYSVEREVIPVILQGSDLICSGPSGHGKTTSYYLAILHQLIPTPGEVHVVILGHTRELVYHLEYNFRQFYRHIPGITSRAFMGGRYISIRIHIQTYAYKHT
jgi:superfamily II DNA/RNA helicase